MNDKIREQIIDLMLDGRERTINDVVNRLKLGKKVVAEHLFKMTHANELVSEWVGQVTIYRIAGARK